MESKSSIFRNKSEKKELTPMQQKVRSVLNWVVTILCVVVIVFALVVAIFTISGATNDRHLMQFGDKIYMNVASDSMTPTFDKSDMIIVDAFDKSTDIDRVKVGMVITFEASINGYAGYNTHRIVAINKAEDGTVKSVRTRGDKKGGNWQDAVGEDDGSWDSQSVSIDKIVATWGSVDEAGNFTNGKMLKGVGAFSNWIQDTDHPGEDSSAKVRFFCVIVLPLILLFVIYAFILVRTLIIAKLENHKPVQAEQVVTVDSLSDDEKRRLAEEYLAMLKAQADAGAQTSADSAENAEKANDDVQSADGAQSANEEQFQKVEEKGEENLLI